VLVWPRLLLPERLRRAMIQMPMSSPMRIPTTAVPIAMPATAPFSRRESGVDVDDAVAVAVPYANVVEFDGYPNGFIVIAVADVLVVVVVAAVAARSVDDADVIGAPVLALVVVLVVLPLDTVWRLKTIAII
jgi:hypothetical protein